MFKSNMGDSPSHSPSKLRRRVLAAAVGSTFGWALPAMAQRAVTGAAANAAAVAKSGTVLELQAGAPDRYVVQRGDTLWGISNRFLKEPWRWPEFWRFNSADIKNPHLIYPGQVLVLDRFSTRMALDDRTQPRIRVEGGRTDAIPSIPANVIEPWLTRPLVIEPDALDNAPHIVATEEGRVQLGPGGRAYVMNMPADTQERAWQIYRKGRPLIDPDTNQVLGIEAVYVGIARLTRFGDAGKKIPSTIVIQRAQIEVSPGDRLVPAERARLIQYMPRAPQNDLNSRVISIYGGRGEQSEIGSGMDDNRTDVANFDARREAGPLQVVSINRGTRDGTEVGHVLALHRSSKLEFDRSVGDYYMGSPRPEAIQLPEERYGLLFVFRTFERVSYGLIVQAQRTVVPGDIARKPV